MYTLNPFYSLARGSWVRLFGPSSSSSSDPPPPETPPPPPVLDLTRPLPDLPPELVQQIINDVVEPLLPPTCAPYDTYLKERKAVWGSFVGIATSNRYYRGLLFRKWFYVLVVNQTTDWDLIRTENWMGFIQPHVRIVIATAGALASSPRVQTDTEILACFDRLTSVSVDYHNDFLRAGGQFPYYQLVRKLPGSLQRLEILNAHGPDEQIINLVAHCCPELTELRLGRCTMFCNRDCVWWKAHPGDHDAYMADRGVEAYAGAVGNLIKTVPKLRVLHIGVYLTPIEAVWAHRVDHRQLHPIFDSMRHENPEGVHNHLHQVALAMANGEDPDPPINYNYPPLARKEIWDAPCVLCDQRFKVPAEKAEMRTAAVIAARGWSLREVSFASFTSPGRVGASTWQVVPRDGVTGEELASEYSDQVGQLIEEKGEAGHTITVDVGRSLNYDETASRMRFTFRMTWSEGEIKVSAPLTGTGISPIF